MEGANFPQCLRFLNTHLNRHCLCGDDLPLCLQLGLCLDIRARHCANSWASGYKNRRCNNEYLATKGRKEIQAPLRAESTAAELCSAFHRCLRPRAAGLPVLPRQGRQLDQPPADYQRAMGQSSCPLLGCSVVQGGHCHMPKAVCTPGCACLSRCPCPEAASRTLSSGTEDFGTGGLSWGGAGGILGIAWSLAASLASSDQTPVTLSANPSGDKNVTNGQVTKCTVTLVAKHSVTGSAQRGLECDGKWPVLYSECRHIVDCRSVIPQYLFVEVVTPSVMVLASESLGL